MKTIVFAVTLLFILTLSVHANSFAAGQISKSRLATISSESVNERDAKGELAKLAAALEATKGITFQSAISYAAMGNLLQASCSAGYTLEKPNKFSIQISTPESKHAYLFGDGSNVTIFNPTTMQYCITPAATLPTIVQGATADATAVSNDDPILLSDLEAAFSFPATYLGNRFDISKGGSGSIKYTITKSKVDGVAEDIVTQTLIVKSLKVIVTYAIDDCTNLPISFNEAINKAGSNVFTTRQSISDIQAITTPMTASTYVFTPPTSASAVDSPLKNEEATLLKTGTNAPNFQVTCSTGKTVHLADFAGHVVVLDFWATWCEPCQQALPHVDDIARVFQKRSVVFIPVCTWDEKGAFGNWVKAHKKFAMSFYFDPAAEDQDKSIAGKLYSVNVMPTTYVIGKYGKVVYGTCGYDYVDDPADNQLRIAIKKAIAEP